MKKKSPHFCASPDSNVEQNSADLYSAAHDSVAVRADDRLALDWLFSTDKGKALSERVVARLIQAEAHEPLVYLKDDLRISQLTVLHAFRGDAVQCTPHVLATYTVLGCHPDQVFERIMLHRLALLGERPTKISSARHLPANSTSAEPAGAESVPKALPHSAPVTISRKRRA